MHGKYYSNSHVKDSKLRYSVETVLKLDTSLISFTIYIGILSD